MVGSHATHPKTAPGPQFSLITQSDRDTVSCIHLHRPEALLLQALHNVWVGLKFFVGDGRIGIAGVFDIGRGSTQSGIIVDTP